MRVRELLDLLPGIEPQYQGDLDAAFTGMTTGLPRRPPKGRFIVVRDDSWPAETKGEDPDVPSRRRAERRIRAAFSRGASGVICSSSLQSSSVVEGSNVFFSTDTYELVRGMTAAVRSSLGDQRITAVTGSAGKTTVKSMVVHALRACGAGRVTSTPGNKNMYRTVLSSISQSGQYEHTVIEASSAAFLAYRQHDFSISPDVGIITSIAEAHLDYVGSLENLIGVKSDIFRLPRREEQQSSTGTLCVQTFSWSEPWPKAVSWSPTGNPLRPPFDSSNGTRQLVAPSPGWDRRPSNTRWGRRASTTPSTAWR